MKKHKPGNVQSPAGCCDNEWWLRHLGCDGCDECVQMANDDEEDIDWNDEKLSGWKNPIDIEE